MSEAVLTEFFRAAHLLNVNSYWGVMVRGVYRWALLKVVPAHFDLIPIAHHRAVATDLINLAYCSGLPEDMIRPRIMLHGHRRLDGHNPS